MPAVRARTPRLAAPRPSSSRLASIVVAGSAPRRSWPRRGPRRSRPAATPTAPASEVEVVVGRATSGQAERGQPGVDRADDLDARARRGRTPRRRAIAERRRRPASPGPAAAQRRSAEHDGQRQQRRRPACGRCVSPRFGDDAPEPSRRSRRSPLSMPNSFGTWPMMIVSARPTMKPLSTGSEMKLARKPSRSSPASERDDAGRDAPARP